MPSRRSCSTPSEAYRAYDPLTEGAGFVNAKGAVELARYLVDASTSEYPDASRWGGTLIWGNLLVKGGRLTADANAWSVGVTWGADRSEDGQQISWGTRCGSESCATTASKWRVDGGSVSNVVWGSICKGANCDVPWSVALVSGVDGATVVWGTDDGETWSGAPTTARRRLGHGLHRPELHAKHLEPPVTMSSAGMHPVDAIPERRGSSQSLAWGTLSTAAQLYVLAVLAAGTAAALAWFPTGVPQPLLFVLLLSPRV